MSNSINRRCRAIASLLSTVIRVVALLLASWMMPVGAVHAQSITDIHDFNPGPNGSSPYAGLIVGNDGNYYGTTEGGGAYGMGTVFQITPAGVLTTLQSFYGADGASPEAGLVQGSDGNFYGTTYAGGSSDHGTVFQITQAGVLTTLHSFTGPDGTDPWSITQGSDGSFYGTTYGGGSSGGGTIFRITSTGVLTTLHSFTGIGTDGSDPITGLIQGINGNFYGTTFVGGSSGYGTVFSITSAGTLTTLHSFMRSDGALPYAGLVQGSDGNLYGTTSQGGTGSFYSDGTVFMITPTGALTTLYSFSGADGNDPKAILVQGSDGNFYGTTSLGGASNLGTVYQITMAGALTTLHSFTPSSGSDPTAGLVQGSDGNLYGTTDSGGASGNGTIYQINTAGVIDTFYSFPGDGVFPEATLAQGSDGDFYGTTFAGGEYNYGTVFQVTPAGVLTTLHSFTGLDGSGPRDRLVQGPDGNFYGTTVGGAVSTIFKITPGGILTTLETLGLSDPIAGLTLGSDGNFYGTTEHGGVSGNGSVFQITEAGTFSTLHSFTGTDGNSPIADLIQGSDGNFYGTTEYGGAAGDGTVFQMTPYGTLTTLHSFFGTDGANPAAGMVQDSNSNLYGTTLNGGTSGIGTVFQILSNDAFATLHSFTTSGSNTANPYIGSDGAKPLGDLVQGSDGNFYGTTEYGGADGTGSIFQVTPAGRVTALVSLSDPGHPQAGLVLGTDGNYYGTTPGGGQYNFGAVFEFAITPDTPTALTATALGSAQITLAWTASPGATSYSVFRGTTPGGETSTPVQTVTTDTCTDNNLVPGVTYYYTVKAFDGALGPASNEAFATALPTAPTSLTVEAEGLEVGLNWTAGLASTSYNVYRGTTPGGENSTPIASGITVTYYLDRTGSYGITYYYTVKGLDGGALSPASNEAHVTIVPPPPTGLAAMWGNGEITLSWTGSTGATSYNIYRALTAGSEGPTPIITGVTGLTYTDTGLTNGTTYYYKAIAFDSGGSSNFSNETHATPEPLATVATAASATPNPVTGTTTNVSVLGSYTGPGGLIYTWNSTGPAPVNFSPDGTYAANNSIATFSKAGVYTITATISSPYSFVSSSVNVTVNQTLTSITVAPGPTLTLTLVTTQQFAATGLDQFGNPMASQPTFAWALISGVGSINSTGLYHTGSTPGTATIKGKSSTLSGSCVISVNEPAPTVATAASASSNPVNGLTTNLSVFGAYAGPGGAASLTYTWTETAGPASVTFSSNGTNAAASSTATFTQAGSYTLQATIANPYGGTVTSSVNVTVNQTITSLTVAPTSITLNVDGAQTFIATARDQFGNALATQPSFAWSLASGSIGSINAASGAYSAGLAQGSATVRATSGAISGTASVTVTDTGPTVATEASANPNPITGTSTALSVLGTDPAGESTLTYTWASTGPAAVTYSDNGDNTAKNATATFAAAGNYVLTVTIANPYGGTTTSSVNVTVNQTLASIAVLPTSVNLSVGGGNTFSAIANDQFGTALGAQPAFAWSVDAGSVGSINSVNGIYAVGIVLGSATVRASRGTVSGTASVTVTDTGPTVATAASANPSPVAGTTTALSVLGADPAGESTLTYTWSSTGPGAVTYGDNGDNTAKNATATFAAAGDYVLTVTIANPYGGTTTSSVNVTVNQTLATIAVSPAPVNLTVGGGDTFSAIAYDQFGMALGTQPAFVWSLDAGGVGSINSGNGIYAAGLTPGSATVRATSGAVSGTASVTITDTGPTVATAASANPNPVAGTTTALSVLGADPAGESTLTYTWSSTGPGAVTYGDNGDNTAKNPTATFTAAGAYVLTVTIANPFGGTITSSVNVTVTQTYTSIALTPGPTLTVTAPATQQFTAITLDQFGNALATQPSITWTITSGVGSVNSTSGLYHSGTVPGAASVKAKSGGISASVAVTVNPSPVTVSAAATAIPNPAGGAMTTLSAMGAYAGSGGLTYTWTVTGPASVAFSANGTSTASTTTASFSQAGSYSFTVTIASPYTSTTSSVTVIVNQTLTAIVVTPGPTLTINPPLPATQQFTAIGLDQFGVAMSVQPSIAWALASGVGSVSSTGLYHSGTVAGSASVKAKSGSVSGTCAVTVN